MSSIRSSFDEVSVMVACTWTRPCSTRSPEEDADDPDRHGDERGDLGDGARVAGRRGLRSAAGLRSGLKPPGWRTQGGLHREVDRRLGATGRDRVRADEPCATVLRTARPRRRGSQVPRRLTVRPRRRRGPGLHRPPDAVDQQRHLVADLADVRGLLGQYGEVGAVADAHQHQVAVLHLHDGLQHGAAVEEASRTDAQAGEPGRDGGDLLGTFARDAGAGRHQEAVGRDQDGVGRVRHLVDEPGDQPVEVALVARLGAVEAVVLVHAGPASVCWGSGEL